MKKVLVTGASGFIGRQALSILKERGFEVHAVSTKTSLDDDVTWHHADLLSGDDRKMLVEKVQPTHVLHFAWIATPGVYWTSPLNQDWHDATVDLLELSKKFGVERFVGAGSCAEYDWSQGLLDEASTPLTPATPYGKAKAACGQSVIDSEGISTAWGRIFLLYGPHEHPKRLVSSVIQSLLKGEVAECTHGKQIRDFLHVRDVASAFVSLLESDVTGAVNIASGEPTSIQDVVSEIARQIGREDLVKFGAITPPPNDPPELTAAIARLQNEVGWKPKFSLESGIKNTIDWWRSQGS